MVGDLQLVQIFPDVPTPTDGNSLYKKGALVGLHVDGERRGNVRIETVMEHH